MAPASRVNKGKGSVRWLTCIHVESDNNLRHHCLNDVACSLTCHLVFIPLKRCVFALLLLSIRLVVLSIWLVTWHCHVVVLVGVVKRLQEAEVIGGGGD